MALQKPIQQEDGVVTNYHRILFVMQTINSHISIAVLSYVDESARAVELNSREYRPYKKSVTYEIKYKENFTVEDAYLYLKTLKAFDGAIDV